MMAAMNTTRDRARMAVLAVPMVAATIVAQIGDAFAPTLLVEHPLLLVAMVARTRYLVLAAPLVDPVALFVVGFTRLLLTDPIFFVFGRRYGDRAIAWAERKSGSPRTVRTVERGFKKASGPIVAVAPNNLICVLAGATGMRVGPFLALNLGGTAVRLGLVLWLGDAFSDPLLEVIDFIARYRWWLTAGSIVIVAITLWRARRLGTTEIESPSEIARELEPQEPGDAPDSR